MDNEKLIKEVKEDNERRCNHIWKKKYSALTKRRRQLTESLESLETAIEKLKDTSPMDFLSEFDHTIELHPYQKVLMDEIESISTPTFEPED